MSHLQIATLISAGFGLAGTIILFFASWAMQPLIGAAWGSPVVTEANIRIGVRNRWRKHAQRVGLIFLCLSFAMQGVTAFLM